VKCNAQLLYKEAHGVKTYPGDKILYPKFSQSAINNYATGLSVILTSNKEVENDT